ncbi:helix-turn-helix domain-containing protein [Syntrophomonas wolfei]|jgi:excisionase family DNA binding protein|uniref:helix-turn-helix domain-containing protein n=1 Tax=Syntrophomonas wolfei TaxID=863 RepID=UPI0023F3C62D|nr:helix-turn-helix domain-containing protein [Syntrophomonas wolfei]
METLDRANPDTWPFIMQLKEFMWVSGYGKNKALELVQSGELPAKKVRGTWLISKDALLRWLEG